MPSVNAREKIINHDRRLPMRPGPAVWPLKGLRAPLPREVGKETLLEGLRRSCLRVWLLSLDLLEELLVEVEVVAAGAPSTSMSTSGWS